MLVRNLLPILSKLTVRVDAFRIWGLVTRWWWCNLFQSTCPSWLQANWVPDGSKSHPMHHTKTVRLLCHLTHDYMDMCVHYVIACLLDVAWHLEGMPSIVMFFQIVLVSCEKPVAWFYENLLLRIWMHPRFVDVSLWIAFRRHLINLCIHVAFRRDQRASYQADSPNRSATKRGKCVPTTICTITPNQKLKP